MSAKQASEPIFYVLVQPEGKTEASRVDTSDVVIAFEFDEDEKKADKIVLTVDNWDLSNFDNPIWKQGNKLIATWGYPGNMAPARECVITKVTGSVQLKVEALSKSILMNKKTQTKTYENTRRSEIVHAIAKDYGYSDEQRDIEDTEVTYPHITQAGLTDAQFIRHLANLEHFEFYVDFDGLHWHSRRMGQKPLRVLQYYLPPNVGDIITFDVENDVFAKPGQVKTKGRDPLKKQDVGGDASDSKTERAALNPVTEIIDPATGLTTFQTNTASEQTKPTTATSDKQAKREADGALKKSLQTTVKMTIDMVGDPGLFRGCVVELRGISKRLSGLYYIHRTNHRIDSSGYKLKLHVLTDGTKGHSKDLLDDGKKPASKAKVNTATAEKKDPGAAEIKETIDPATGLTAYQYSGTSKPGSKDGKEVK